MGRKRERQGLVSKEIDTVHVPVIEVERTENKKEKYVDNGQPVLKSRNRKKLLNRIRQMGCPYVVSWDEIGIHIWFAEGRTNFAWTVYFNNPELVFHVNGRRPLSLYEWETRYRKYNGLEPLEVVGSYDSVFLPKEEGLKLVEEHVLEFKDSGRNTILRTSAGSGKSTMARRLLFEKGLKVAYFIDKHTLAREAYEGIMKFHPNLNGRVIQGRTHKSGNGEFMCFRNKEDLYGDPLIDAFGKRNISVYRHLCWHRHTKIKCKRFDDCPYLKQFRDDWDFVVLTHDYLTIYEPDYFEFPKFDLLILDECFSDRFIGSMEIALETIHDYRKAHNDVAEKPILFELIHWIADRGMGSLIPRLKARGITKEKVLTAKERADDRNAAYFSCDIHPLMDKEEIQWEFGYLDGHPLGISKLFETIANEYDLYERGFEQTHTIGYKDLHRRKKDNRVDGVSLHYLKELNQRYRDVPKLILDATADRSIVEDSMDEEFMFREVKIKDQAEKIQIYNSTFSKTKLTRSTKGHDAVQLVEDVQTVVDRETEGGNRVLTICQEVVEDKLKPQENFTATHFNAERGLNEFEDCDVEITIGRPQPSVDQLEDIERSFAFKREEPIDFIETEISKAGKEIKALPFRKWEVKTKTGSSEIVDVSFHPDQGCNRHLLQIRECGLEQAVARLRGIHHSHKRNVILCSVPLDMEIDRLVAWKEFLNYGDERLNIVIDEFDFEQEVMPLTPVSWLPGLKTCSHLKRVIKLIFQEL